MSYQRFPVILSPVWENVNQISSNKIFLEGFVKFREILLSKGK